MEIPTNHYTTSSELTIYQLVLNRLPFLQDTDTNKVLISAFILEVMFELEICFKIDADDPEPTHIGNEEYYTFFQKSIIADIVAYYILFLRVIGETAGTSDGTVTGDTRYLKRAKAGSVEVEWGQFDTKLGGMRMAGDAMMTLYKKSAMRKAAKLGCVIDICDDCTLSASNLDQPFIPFRVVVDSDGCGCGGTSAIDSIVERDTRLKNG